MNGLVLALRAADIDWPQVGLLMATLLFSLSFHESAHAWMANKLGDPTGKLLGRITLNPVPHIDPFGTILLPLVMFMQVGAMGIFAYAKPVPYNPYALRNPAAGSALIAAAGPASNLVLAFLAAVTLGLLSPGGQITVPTLGHQLLMHLVTMNVLLAVFNLIPIPPLDGGAVLVGLLPRGPSAALESVRPFGFAILIMLSVSGVLSRFIYPPIMVIEDNLLTIARSLRG